MKYRKDHNPFWFDLIEDCIGKSINDRAAYISASTREHFRKLFDFVEGSVNSR